MAEYNPSKIIKDGNTYNFRDDTKIPLAGSNQISGSLIPATDNSIDIGSSTKNIKMLYTKGITINGTQFLPSDYIPRSGGNVLTGEAYRRNVDGGAVGLYGGTAWDNSAYISLSSTTRSGEYAGCFLLQATTSSSSYRRLIGYPNGTLTWGTKNVAMQEDVVPRSGGAVLTGTNYARNVNNSTLELWGGTGQDDGGSIILGGSSFSWEGARGSVIFTPRLSETDQKRMFLRPDGTWTWNGTACQITSDQRYKQQIAEIDDKLLDAWEDVDLVQFKYNDAVDQKGDNARLHTGYVVQQIDSACKSHGVDISAYGLYCHEEYPQETKEIEVENEDGTKTKETKVIREASEHYSLRYTETLVVECAYLRKKNKELQEQLDKLSARLDKLENASSK